MMVTVNKSPCLIDCSFNEILDFKVPERAPISTAAPLSTQASSTLEDKASTTPYEELIFSQQMPSLNQQQDPQTQTFARKVTFSADVDKCQKEAYNEEFKRPANKDDEILLTSRLGYV